MLALLTLRDSHSYCSFDWCAAPTTNHRLASLRTANTYPAKPHPRLPFFNLLVSLCVCGLKLLPCRFVDKLLSPVSVGPILQISDQIRKMKSWSQRVVTFLFTVTVYRALPFTVALWASRFLLEWVPTKAQLFVTILCVLVSVATYSLYPEHTYKKLVPVCILLALTLLLHLLGVVTDRALVWIVAGCGVAGCILSAFLSAFVGARISKPVGHGLLAISLGAPLAAALCHMLHLGLVSFDSACLLSVAASCGNVFFNSRGHSIGVPFARIDTSHRDGGDERDNSPVSPLSRPSSPPRSPVLRPYAMMPLAASGSGAGFRSRSLS
jgi:hypothetical protein